MLDNELYLMHIEQAKKRIRDVYKQTDGNVYLSFSGGKDSTIVLSLIKDIGLNIPAVFSDTGLELAAIKDFVKWVKDNYYNNVIIIKPEKSYNEVIKDGKPFLSKMKSTAIKYYQKNPKCKTALELYNEEYVKSHRIRLANKDFHILHENFNIKISDNCCYDMKKRPFEIYVEFSGARGSITGIRAYEGGQRAFNYDRNIKLGKNPCTEIKKGGFIQKSPIIDWTDEMCELYIKNHNVPLSKAYTEYGLKRTGCYLCPYDRDLEKRLEILYKYEPNKYKAALYYMQDVYIAQGVKLDFDENYMNEYNKAWVKYEKMRYDVLSIYRPNCNIVKKGAKTK